MLYSQQFKSPFKWINYPDLIYRLSYFNKMLDSKINYPYDNYGDEYSDFLVNEWELILTDNKQLLNQLSFYSCII